MTEFPRPAEGATGAGDDSRDGLLDVTLWFLCCAKVDGDASRGILAGGVRLRSLSEAYSVNFAVDVCLFDERLVALALVWTLPFPPFPPFPTLLPLPPPLPLLFSLLLDAIPEADGVRRILRRGSASLMVARCENAYKTSAPIK